MSDFLMPSLGADMDEGILVEWTRHPGDTLKRGDVVAVVETQKGAIEIEVFRDGCWRPFMPRRVRACRSAPCSRRSGSRARPPQQHPSPRRLLHPPHQRSQYP